MSNKASTFFPEYRLRARYGNRDIRFSHKVMGEEFSTRIPRLGITETQKAVLQWASVHTPPVVWVSHGAPIPPDREYWNDPTARHRHFTPYAMAVARVYCLGEASWRTVKVYFCHIELHESNASRTVHSRTKGCEVVEV